MTVQRFRYLIKFNFALEFFKNKRKVNSNWQINMYFMFNFWSFLSAKKVGQKSSEGDNHLAPEHQELHFINWVGVSPGDSITRCFIISINF